MTNSTYTWDPTTNQCTITTDATNPDDNSAYNIVTGSDVLASDCCREGHVPEPDIDSLVLACDVIEVYTFVLAVEADPTTGAAEIPESCTSVSTVQTHDGSGEVSSSTATHATSACCQAGIDSDPDDYDLSLACNYITTWTYTSSDPAESSCHASIQQYDGSGLAYGAPTT
jgi:hypothetical protein